MIYSAHCHCGAVRFHFRSDELRDAIRCNCSICIRRGNLMSTAYYALEETSGFDQLALYEWGDHMVKFWFCKHCGIHPFSEVEGKYRVNLGCIDGLDVLALPVTLIDGKSY